MSWRADLDKGLRPYLEQIIRESFLYKNIYSQADDPGKAQLWVAMAILSKKLCEIESKLKLHEAVLKDISPRKASKLKEMEASKKAKEEVERIFKQIAQARPIQPAQLKVAKSKSKKKAGKIKFKSNIKIARSF